MHYRASLREPYMLFGTTRFSKGTGGQIGGGIKTEHIAGRAGHHRASTYAPLTVHTELHETLEHCSGYNPSFEGLRGAFENLE